MKDILTTTLVTILVGLSVFIYMDFNSACGTGTPGISAEVQNYVDSQIARMKSSGDQTSDSKPLAELAERVLKLQKIVAATEASVQALEIFQQVTPPETFEFKDAPVTIEERLRENTDIIGKLVSRVRRFCMAGGQL